MTHFILCRICASNQIFLWVYEYNCPEICRIDFLLQSFPSQKSFKILSLSCKDTRVFWECKTDISFVVKHTTVLYYVNMDQLLIPTLIPSLHEETFQPSPKEYEFCLFLRVVRQNLMIRSCFSGYHIYYSYYMEPYWY